MKLYLSGPMTGLPDHNREAFNKREGMLKRRGYDVVNPARTDLGPNATWLDYMRVAMRQISEANGIAQLGDWQTSPGALLEASWAASLGMPIATVPEWIADYEIKPPAPCPNCGYDQHSPHDPSPSYVRCGKCGKSAPYTAMCGKLGSIRCPKCHRDEKEAEK